MEIKQIAHIKTEFSEKFGIPRQSGLAPDLTGIVVFEPGFRNSDLIRGLEDFSHIWLLWEFSANQKSCGGQSVVRPPRLGGNQTMGVLATRSPYRPNPIGLSCVKLEKVSYDSAEGPVLIVKGADLMDGTPIYDIKPYIRYADSHPEAICGYVDSLKDDRLEVVIPDFLRAELEDKKILAPLVQSLSLDPRPSYHDDSERVYGMEFMGYNVRFHVSDRVLSILEIVPLS